MHILKLLAPLETLESGMADLYEWLSQVFSDDKEAASFFYRLSIEEVVHANIIKYQRRLVSANPKAFGEIEADIDIINRINSEISAFRNSSERLHLRDALKRSIEFEKTAAEEHCGTLIVIANPEVQNLLTGLGVFDRRHMGSFYQFAAARGYDDLSGTLVSAARLRPEPVPVQEIIRVKQASDLGSDFLQRLEYLSEWHRTMGYYKFLGVKEYATDEQIKHAYLKIMKEFHPDRYFGYPDEITRKLKEIVEYAVDAHETLLNPLKRKVYDSRRPSLLRR